MNPEPGTISCGPGGVLHILVDAERYRIEPEDAKSLLFSGRVVPIVRDCSKAKREDYQICDVTIEGHAAINRSGKAVAVHTRVGSYIVPVVSLQRVARGEAASAPLFPIIPEETG